MCQWVLSKYSRAPSGSQGFLFFSFHWLCLVFVVVCWIFIRGLRTLSCSMGDLVPWPGIEPGPPALAAWSLSHWPSREVLWWFFLHSAFPSLVFCPVSSSYLGVPGPSSWDHQLRDSAHSARAPRLDHSLQIISRQEAGMGLPWWLSRKGSACNAGDAGSIPRWGWYPEEGHGNPLQYSCLKNPTDRGAWGYTTPHGVAKSQTRLSN